MPGVDKLVDELYPLKYITGINQHFRIINKSFRIAGNKNDFFRTPTLRQCGNCTALLMGSRARRIHNHDLHTIQIFRLKRRLEQIAADYPDIVDLITVQSILQPFKGSAGSDAPDISKSALKKLIALARTRGDNKARLFLSDRLNDVYDNDIPLETASSLVELQKDYDSRRGERLYHANLMRMGGAAVVLLMVMAGVIIYHRRKIGHYGRVISRQNMTLEELNTGYTRDLENYRSLKLRLEALQQAREKDVRLIEEKTHEMEQMQAQLATYQNDRRKPEQWDMEDRLISDDRVYALHRRASAGRLAEPQDWNALHQLTNRYDGNLCALFANHSNLSPNEINVIILTRLRFIPTEIAVLTGMSSQSVTNTRARLLQKIFGVKGGAKDFDDRIRSL